MGGAKYLENIYRPSIMNMIWISTRKGRNLQLLFFCINHESQHFPLVFFTFSPLRLCNAIFAILSDKFQFGPFWSILVLIHKNNLITLRVFESVRDFGRSSSFLALSRPYFINHFPVWRPGPSFLNFHQKGPHTSLVEVERSALRWEKKVIIILLSPLSSLLSPV